MSLVPFDQKIYIIRIVTVYVQSSKCTHKAEAQN